MDRKEIADYLAKKMFNREKVFNRELELGDYIILKNKLMYSERDYGRLVKSNKLSPDDTFVYIYFIDYEEGPYNEDLIDYLFPLTHDYSIFGIVKSYLSKLGFYNLNNDVSPATGLKYYGEIALFKDRLVIEIVDIYTVVTNTRLVKIVTDVLCRDILTQRQISSKQIGKISYELRTQELFVGHNRNEAYSIIYRYYIHHDASLAKEVLAIANAYNRIFEPYRVVYDTRTRQQVLM